MQTARCMVLATVFGVCAGFVVAAEEAPSDDDTASKWAWLHRSWYVDQGIELPRTFGVSLNLIFMERDIEITDVIVTVGNRPPESISDRASFDVSNRTSLTMMRFDAWVLPFLDLYVMAGQTRTDTNLSVAFEITPPVGNPIPVEITQNQKVDGPLFGGGGTMVFGSGSWFAMLDANYGRSSLDVFEGTLDAWFLSGRVGWHRTTDNRQLRVWGGVAYLDSRRTLTITTDVPVFGETRVEVDQRAVNPTTIEVGGSLSFNRRWDILLELGTNFDDAFLAVTSVSYRF